MQLINTADATAESFRATIGGCLKAANDLLRADDRKLIANYMFDYIVTNSRILDLPQNARLKIVIRDRLIYLFYYNDYAEAKFYYRQLFDEEISASVLAAANDS
jgi:hypothetical protein